VLAAWLFVLVVTGSARATTILYRTDAELVAASARVVRVRVIDVRAEPAPDGGAIYTVARLAVREDLTGFRDPVIEVRELGGVLGERRVWVGGAARFAVGDELLMCLTQRNGVWRTVAMAFSTFDVADGAGAPVLEAPAADGGALAVRRQASSADVLGAPAGDGARPRTVAQFRQLVLELKGTRPVAFASIPPDVVRQNAGTPPPAIGQFTLLSDIRWFEPDTSAPVRWYRNPDAAPPLTSGNVDTEIGTAALAWTLPPGASLDLTFSGTRSPGGQSPFCSSANAGIGLISFEDPTDEIGPGVLAVGGGCASPSQTVIVNGRTFSRMTHGFVIFNTAAELGPSYQSAPNFTRVMTHELGHGIGLGHTELGGAAGRANLMFPSCCHPEAPIPPALGPDDLAGLQFVYPVVDGDGDTLPDQWELQFGLSPTSGVGADGPGGDPDGDLVNNAQELAAHTHPRGFATRYLAEGVVNEFFNTQIALLNANNQPAIALLRFQPQGGGEQALRVVVPARTRSTVAWPAISQFVGGPFATVVESDRTLVVDRTITWGAGGYGAHAEGAVPAAAPTWYLAEGATGGPFELFYLIQNSTEQAVSIEVTYLRALGMPPLVKSYTVNGRSRATIWVDDEVFPTAQGGQKLLAGTDVSAVVRVTAGGPVIVERAMYLNRPDQVFAAGHESAGVTAPSTHWFLAEGATGAFFDEYILIANPSSSAASVRTTYLLTNGSTVTKTYTIAPESRFTIWVDEEQFPAGSGVKPLNSATFSTVVESLNGVGIIAERAMWWPSGNWYEAHNTVGATQTGSRWAVAEGEAGGPSAAQTYLLVANVSPSQVATVRLTTLAEDGQVREHVFNDVPPNSRFTINVAAVFPDLVGRRFWRYRRNRRHVRAARGGTGDVLRRERRDVVRGNGVTGDALAGAVAASVAERWRTRGCGRCRSIAASAARDAARRPRACSASRLRGSARGTTPAAASGASGGAPPASLPAPSSWSMRQRRRASSPRTPPSFLLPTPVDR